MHSGAHKVKHSVALKIEHSGHTDPVPSEITLGGIVTDILPDSGMVIG